MQIKMSEGNQNEVAAPEAREGDVCCMKSVNRVSKLPVVESTVQTATSLYSKVKDFNSITNWTFSTAESTVNKAIEVGKPIAAPVVAKLDGPIKRVDQMLCTGLDYVETNVPAVKLPTGELYNSTKDYVGSAYAKVQPAVEAAKHAVEPCVQNALHLAEPALERANALKDYGTHKVEELLQRHHGEQPEADTPTNVDSSSSSENDSKPKKQ